MGRKRLPALKHLDGNPSKRVIKELGNVKGFGDAFIPSHLTKDARECVETVKASMPPELYKKIDSYHLAVFGMIWAIHKRATEEIAKPNFKFLHGYAGGKQYPSPWLKILNEQAHLLAALGDRLGLDPRSRMGLRLPEERAQSKFDGLIGQGLTAHSASSSSLKN